jgi:hypothetical protein
MMVEQICLLARADGLPRPLRGLAMTLFWDAGDPEETDVFAELFLKSDRLLIPTVINNDRWYKTLFLRVAAPPAPRAIPTALED